MEERLQKLLSAAGVCSRRAAEGYITAGRVTVNGTVARLGDKADVERDAVKVDGRLLGSQSRRVWLMLHKPRGYVTTLSDEKGRKTVGELVRDCGVRVWPVGRLDLNSEGLLLFTNDGEGTNRVLHPSREIEKEYHVTVTGDVTVAIPILAGPGALAGPPGARAWVMLLRKTSVEGELSVVIHEGKNRQVRRMCALAGLEVRRLIRVREGRLQLGSLPLGKWRALTSQEVEELAGD